MRLICLWLPSVAAAVAQPIGFGVKGGMPMTDFLNTAENNLRLGSNSTTNRYIVGPSIELRLPHGLGIELDALYRHFRYSFYYHSIGTYQDTRTTSSAWEFPLVGKYKLRSGLVSPYVEAGVSWDRLSGLTQVMTTTTAFGATSTSTSSSYSEVNRTTTGFVVGAGLDIKAILIHITPEIRYTRWSGKHFTDPGGFLNSNQNQAEFLVGFKF